MTTGSERRWKDIGVNGDQNEASSRDPRHLGDMVTSVKLPRPLTQEKPYVIAMNGDERAPNRDRRRLENGHGRIPTHRTVSSPMMPAFMVSAPGKVIVFGEHAVVYGKAAMAAAISLRSYLLVTSLSKSHRTVTLRFPDISLVHTWDIDSLPWTIFSHPSKKKYYYDLVTTLDLELLQAIEPHVSAISTGESPEARKIHQSSACAFLYLFLSLSSRSTCGSIYTLRSTIPIGAGLGSSASISVCLSTALLLQIRALAGPHPDQPTQECMVQLERINRWAFVAEMCIHGNPSGVDNTVATEGKAVLFRREDYQKPPTVTPLRDFPELPLLLVNTKLSRSTAVEVAKVGALMKTQPVVGVMMLDSINTVTASAYRLIEEATSHQDPSRAGYDDNFFQRLGELIRINHGLLVSLGVSHPRLERIRELVDHAGIGWTKLTGAGGGGCAITMLKPDVDLITLQDLLSQLDREDFEIYQTTLGAHGVGVLWPAVLKSGSDADGGKEIDQEKFLNAEGNDGVRNLVGVGLYGTGDRWQFWRA